MFRPLGLTEQECLETEAAKLLWVALPVLRHLDAEVEIDLAAEQPLDVLTRLGAHTLEARTAGSDDAALLAVPLDEHDRFDVDEVVTTLARRHLLHDDGDRVRQLVAHSEECGLADQLRDH